MLLLIRLHNRSFNTDAQVNPLPSLAASLERRLRSRYVAVATVFAFCLPCMGAGGSAYVRESLTCLPRAGAIARPTDCPYLSELLKGDREFRSEFQRALRVGHVPALSGPEGPVVPLSIAGESCLSGNRCEAHNCSNHRYEFIYSVRKKAIAGIYRSREGKERWFGNPSGLEKRKLKELLGE
jgi:hypothetical protein